MKTLLILSLYSVNISSTAAKTNTFFYLNEVKAARMNCSDSKTMKNYISCLHNPVNKEETVKTENKCLEWENAHKQLCRN